MLYPNYSNTWPNIRHWPIISFGWLSSDLPDFKHPCRVSCHHPWTAWCGRMRHLGCPILLPVGNSHGHRIYNGGKRIWWGHRDSQMTSTGRPRIRWRCHQFKTSPGRRLQYKDLLGCIFLHRGPLYMTHMSGRAVGEFLICIICQMLWLKALNYVDIYIQTWIWPSGNGNILLFNTEENFRIISITRFNNMIYGSLCILRVLGKGGSQC